MYHFLLIKQLVLLMCFHMNLQYFFLKMVINLVSQQEHTEKLSLK